MSLINDALKRARESQSQGPSTPAASPQLRPVDPPQPFHVSPIYFIVGMGMLVIVLGLLLVWQMAQRREIAERVQARAQEVQLARNQGPQPAPLTATPTPAPTAKPVAVAHSNRHFSDTGRCNARTAKTRRIEITRHNFSSNKAGGDDQRPHPIHR